MTGHTKEPWSVFVAGHTTQIDKGVVPHGSRPCVVSWGGFDSSDLPLRVNRANARRIVACVNALAGIENPTAFVEAARGMRDVLVKAGDFIQPFNRAEELLAQVDEALTAFRAHLGEGQSDD